MSLTEYKRKRDFRTTAEPKGGSSSRKGWLYVIQKHNASHLHYDFRLQLGGVLKSWAVPKGPSLNPKVKRLAVHVEDHPVEYGDFEGTIPQGQYGGGTVMLWDRGDWTPIEDPEEGYRKGRLKFTLNGSKLQGGWMLVRKGGANASSDERNWFLIKERDDRASDDQEVVDVETRSVLTNRTLEEIAESPNGVWDSSSKSDRHESTESPSKRKVAASSEKAGSANDGQGIHRPRIPKSVAPQLATLVDQPPVGDEWLNEIKFDGYRMICRIENGVAQFFSRNQQDWTQKLSVLAEDVSLLPSKEAILDGEIVALDSSGVSRFQLLQNAFRDQKSGSLQYYVFDLLHLDGKNLTSLPLDQRKQLLSDLIGSAKKLKQVHFTEHVVGNGPEFFEQAKKLKLEGIISKRADSVYSSGRSHDWLKCKCFQRDEFVIGGFTDPSGSRDAFGALLIGYHNDKHKLVYAGKVGTGFSEKVLSTVIGKLRTVPADQSQFTDYPTGRGSTRHIHWVQPKIVAQIEFSNWTNDGKLRHPAFLGLREDKPAADVVRDAPVSVEEVEANSTSKKKTHSNGSAKPRKSAASKKSKSAAQSSSRSQDQTVLTSADELLAKSGVHLTHPDKILYPDQQFTKLDIARYYAAVEKWILPQIGDRLAVLVRCPDGAAKECFYQKHPGQGTPESLRQIPVKEKNATGNYLVIEDTSGLIWLAQVGALEIHVWGSRVDDIERPDRLIFDLDPDPSVTWSRLVESAFQIRQFLRDLGLESFLKTTGGKGLHLVVPIQRRSSWDDAKSFCHAVATAIESADPTHYISKMSKAARQGKIFIDYLRNQRGATSVAPYSTRSRPGATVSVPITWDELKQGVHSDQFNITNVPDRLSTLKHDPWKEMSSTRQSITAAARKAIGLEP